MVHGKAISIPQHVLDKFLCRSIRNGECVQLTTKLARNGYSIVCANAGRMLGHRFSYLFYIDKIHGGLVIDHLCRNRACVNPSHLRATTQRENILSGTGATVKHSKKIRCIKGHPFDAANTRYVRNGRQCRTCCRSRQIERKLTKSEHDRDVRRRYFARKKYNRFFISETIQGKENNDGQDKEETKNKEIPEVTGKQR